MLTTDIVKYNKVIDFWFADEMSKYWFSSTPELDQKIREQFEQVWEKAAAGEYDAWQETAEGCLALVVVLDQLPLNMFRGEAKSFRTENKAIEVTKQSLDKGFDKVISPDKLAFLFMPLMHSENLDDQDLSVKLFENYNLNSNLRFAEHHRGIIRKFGRFPHRNAILGRKNTREEIEYLDSKHAFNG